MKKSSLLLVLVAVLFSCKDKHRDLPDGLYAEIETSKGTILAQLEYQKTPVTVANFVTLAEGKNKFVRAEQKGRPFFDGLKWHRVIKDFMIQGGDPDGNGAGDTGYKFKDEITDLRHDKGGILSMANSGPATNSSQFFITHLATPWLDGLHTVFGHVVDGMETVNSIEQGDVIKSVSIIRKGEGAKKFDAIKVFDNYFAQAAQSLVEQEAKAAERNRLYNEKYKAIADAKKTELDELRKKAKKTTSGLQYAIIKNGSGKKPASGTLVFAHYSGYFESGQLFDSSEKSVAEQFGVYDQIREEQGGYHPIRIEYGKKIGMIPGFIEGLEKMAYGDRAVFFIPSYLAYGDQGAANVVPPGANLIFEVELMEPTN